MDVINRLPKLLQLIGLVSVLVIVCDFTTSGKDCFNSNLCQTHSVQRVQKSMTEGKIGANVYGNKMLF